MKKLLLFLLLILAFPVLGKQGFVHKPTEADRYVWPQDRAVLDKLDQWQDLKFGVLFHYGLYSLPGIVESWSICSEDVDWINRPHLELPYESYKQWYWSLADSISPSNFHPEEWAKIMKDAGMKYVVFTSKHHDGFCTFDSKLTDFTLPAHGGPDMLKGVLDAFRDQGMMAGVYFSKPDWHSQWFWNPQFSTPRRNENYKRDRHPDWWQRYGQFTRGQLGELTSGDYGAIDILWLDGGWVAGEEIGLDDVLAQARKQNPGMLCVDRSIGGRNENYQTPERGIPATALTHPWESCIPLSDDWGWVPKPNWKTPRQVIAMLAQTVAKGGCLLLGVGPTAEGDIQPEIQERLREIGKWLDGNGEAIYSTRPILEVTTLTPDLWFTQSKDSVNVYAIYAPAKTDGKVKELAFTGVEPAGDVSLLGGKKLKHNIRDGKVTVEIPKNVEAPFAVKFSRKSKPQAKEPTTEEKIAQLCCILGWEMYDGTEASGKLKETLEQTPVGGLWATLRADPWTRRTLANGLNPQTAPVATANIQKCNLESTRLGIPLMLAEECPHGHMAIGSTVYPTGLCQASTFNPALIEKMGAAIGTEALNQGATVGYGPVLDVARDPRWSRMEETFGEDVELVSQLGVAFINGMQAAGLPATMKHFTAYGIPTGGHNGAEAEVGTAKLGREYLEPARRAVKDAHVASVMTAYNSIDGTPCTANRALLTDTLRGAWGFDGMVVSDLIAINGLCGSGYAKDYTEAAALALNAGVDMDLGGGVYGGYLRDALDKGLVTEEQVNQAFERVQGIKTRAKKFTGKVDWEGNKRLNRRIATEGTVLLKNDGILPLDKSRIRKIAVLGPNADAMYNQLGDYTAPQAEGSVVTPLMGIRDAAANGCEVAYAKVCGIRQPVSRDSMTRAVEPVIRDADVAVVVVGGSSGRDFKTEYIDTGAATTGVSEGELPDMECGEGMDRCTLDLLGSQRELIEAVTASGVPTIVVYIEGRPLDMNLAAEKSNALLTQWYPGAQGGAALADILFGEANPSGKLPVSVPRGVGQLPVYYSQPRRADYVDGPSSPLFPFGYGLSYTTFSYDSISRNGDNIIVNISNTGTRNGMETVQLYEKTGNSIRLRDFQKVSVPAGQSATAVFPLLAGELLAGPSSANLPLSLTVETKCNPVQVSDGGFTYQGKPYKFIGTNAWYLPILAAPKQGDRQRLMAELDTLQKLGIDNLRILVGSEGADSHQCQISPNLQTAPGEYDQDLLEGLDFLVEEMERRNMKGVFYLTNSWEWSGGYNTYLEWAGKGKPVLPTVDGYNEYLAHATQFFESEKTRKLFADHVGRIVTRYPGSPAIMSWQIANEPRAFSKRNKPQFEKWILETASQIKRLDPSHMVSVGSEGYNGCEVDLDLWTRIHESPDIDYATIHIWPTNWGWADRKELDRDLPQAVEYTREYIDDHCKAIAHTGKPIVIEEFGWPRDGMAFSRDSSTVGRNAYYRYLLEQWKANPQVAGLNFWGWGGLAVPKHESWHKGDPFTCDPAHEQQGLYSVFASDGPTIELIKEYTKNVGE